MKFCVVRVILDLVESVSSGPRSIVVSIGDCGSSDRSSIPLEGPQFFY
ncbi:MAG: hypothetical protein YK1309IOTA_460013 [Marine Group I thaumarchaeote]|nr:MAG: hypothetical protein YK1309IOTA_460013 [Marine Group I thaumarchaeote]